MGPRSQVSLRTRAFRMIRRLTISAGAATVGLTGAFTAAAAVTFAGGSNPPPAPPAVPLKPTPQQTAPPAPIVDVKVVHQAGYAPGTYRPPASSGGVALPRPPVSAPGAMPAPPPPPVCVGTPSKPC